MATNRRQTCKQTDTKTNVHKDRSSILMVDPEPLVLEMQPPIKMYAPQEEEWH